MSGAPTTTPSAATPAPVSSLVSPAATASNAYAYIGPLLFAVLLLYVCWRFLVKKDDVVVHDSPRFRRALEIWDTVIVRSHATPRSTKRFMNRVRCLAMRLKPPAEGESRWTLLWRNSRAVDPDRANHSESVDLTESTLVALAAIYDIAPELVRNDDLFYRATEGVLQTVTAGEVPINPQLLKAFQEAVEKHNDSKQWFQSNWPPTPTERQFFLDLCADVTVRG